MATSFTLIIDFRGLCLFAPHTNEQNVKEMHVLLPDETADHGDHSGGHGHHHPPHLARFFFEDKYNAPGNINTAREEEPFHGLQWDLGAIISGGADLTLPGVVGDVEKYVQPRKKLAKHQLRRGQQVAVKSHVVLARGSCQCHGLAPEFDIGPDRDVPMVSMLRWVIEGVPGNRLAWEFKKLGTGASHVPEALAPVNGIIHLTLLHAPDEPILHVCDHSRPAHFPAYYPVLKGGGPMPRCTGNVREGSCEGETLAQIFGRAPNVFTCMIGKTDVDLDS